MNFRNIGIFSFCAILAGANFNINAQTVKVKVTEHEVEDAFPLVSTKAAAGIYIDSLDYKVVSISANLLAEDVERVTTVKPEVYSTNHIQSEYMVIVGTIGHSKIIDQLITEKKIDVTAIEDQWESFVIKTIKSPFEGVKKALVIVGSNRRATAFGVFTLSEGIGVSPWYYWSDIHPQQKNGLYVEEGDYVQGSPSVKYRGIFINDEGFGGLNVWARKTFDPELGDIGPKTYAKVFELLLRLKANYCWPAMHACTKPFYTYPGNPVVADEYAIVIGTSHCEQMQCNTMTEWDVNEMGPWNYKINRDNIKEFWKERVDASHKYENTYTLGMRGTEDIEMEGADNVADMVSITQQTIEDQRAIIEKSLGKDASSIPQILCTYKEVLVTYQNGLEVPEDVTLVWADDNHGYTRQLSNPKEQERSGGSGVYYHLSLLGTPEGYLWLNTISPSLVAYEMTKAYNYGADRIWMFNIGDIKPHEKELTFSLQLAWDINRWTPANANQFMREWAEYSFGDAVADEIAELMDRYYVLAQAGKPEHNYRLAYSLEELDARLAQYAKLDEDARALRYRLTRDLQAAYYQLIEYPIAGCRWMDEMNLLARRSLIKAGKGDQTALDDAANALKAHSNLDSITYYYNAVNADGKWNYMMNWHAYRDGKMPQYATPEMVEKGKNAPKSVLLDLTKAKLKDPLVYDNGVITNRSKQRIGLDSSNYATLQWESTSTGKTNLWIFTTIPTTYTPSLTFEINRDKRTKEMHHIGNIWHTQAAAPVWYNLGEFEIKKGVNVLNLPLPDSLYLISEIYVGQYPPSKNNYREQVMAERFKSKKSVSPTTVEVIPGLGLGYGVSILPFTAKSLKLEEFAQASWVEYNVNVVKGTNKIAVRTLPTQRIHEGRGVRYAVSVNGTAPKLFDIQAEEFTPTWQDNVIRGFAEAVIDYYATQDEKVSLKVYFLDPGVVMRDIVVSE